LLPVWAEAARRGRFDTALAGAGGGALGELDLLLALFAALDVEVDVLGSKPGKTT